MQQHFDFSVGVGWSIQGSRVLIQRRKKWFQCGGLGLGSNLCEHRMRQLARTANHMTKPRGEERERAGIEDRISSASSVVPSSSRTGPLH